MQVRPIKYVVDIIAPLLAVIFNLCFEAGVFPKRMQYAKVSVLFKNGDKNRFVNYRPIYTLPIFSKALEKLNYHRLISFSDKYDHITSSRFGFRRNCSTKTALFNQK